MSVPADPIPPQDPQTSGPFDAWHRAPLWLPVLLVALIVLDLPATILGALWWPAHSPAWTVVGGAVVALSLVLGLLIIMLPPRLSVRIVPWQWSRVPRPVPAALLVVLLGLSVATPFVPFLGPMAGALLAPPALRLLLPAVLIPADGPHKIAPPRRRGPAVRPGPSGPDPFLDPER